MSWFINPPTRTKRTGLGWWAKININVQSILSAEAFGTALVARVEYISGAGNIASAQAIGTHVLSRGPVSITPAGIVSVEAFGSPKIGPPGILPVSIITAEALGNPSISVGGVNLVPSGIASAEAIGTQSISRGPVSIVPFGIASAETLGAPSLLATYDILTNAIASAETVGNPAISVGPVNIAGAGNIATAEALGEHVLSVGPVSIVPSGLVSGEALGNASLSRGPVSIAPSGIATAEAIGAQTISVGGVSILPSAIPTQEAIGTAAVAITQFLSPLSANRNECDDPYLEYRTIGGSNTVFTDEWAWAGTYSVALVPTDVAQSYYTPPRYGTNGAVASSVGETWTFHCIAHAPADNVATIQLAAHYALTGADGNPNIYPTKFNLALAPGETKVLSYSHTIQEGYSAIRFTPAMSAAYYPNRVFLDAFYQTRDTADMSYRDIGNPAISVGPVDISGAGAIATAEAIGSANVSRGNVNLSPTGIAGAEAIGSPSLSVGPVLITPAGIVTGEAIGTQTISRGGVTLTGAGGIASGEAFGTPSVFVPQVDYLAEGTYFEENKSSATSHTFTPFAGPTFTPGRAGKNLVLCYVVGYKSSSSSITMSATYGGAAMNSTAIAFGNGSNSGNTSYSCWFWIFTDTSGQNIQISDSTPGFATPYIAAQSWAFTEVGSVANYYWEGGTESGTAMSVTTSAATTPGSKVMNAMVEEVASASPPPSNYSHTVLEEMEAIVYCMAIVGVADGNGSNITFTATRDDSGSDYHESIIEILPATS